MSEKVEYILTINDKGFKQAMDNAAKEGGKLDGVMGNLGKGLALIGGTAAFISLGKQVFNVRAEFQRFESQLTTALGSESQAMLAMAQITKFAAETPFGVKEITEAYVKLANRGVTPTMDQLRKMGDLSAALGKPIEQLNEAVLDIHNDRRWTELGIKVHKNGDKIIGTFRGVTKEFEATEQGAMKMAAAFGEMEGVTGGMARQMETLGGQFSNLEDNWDSLMNNIGKSSEGVFNYFMSGINDMLSSTNEWLSTMNHVDQKLKQVGKSDYQTKSSNALTFFDVFLGTNMGGSAAKYNSSLGAFQKEIDKILTTGNSWMQEKQEKLGKKYTDKEKFKDQKQSLDDLAYRLKFLAKDAKTRDQYEELIAKSALLEQASKDFKEGFGKKKIGAGGSGTGGPGAVKKESDSVRGKQYTQISIQINELVHDFRVETTTVNGATGTMKEVVTKALIEAVNDFQIITGG